MLIVICLCFAIKFLLLVIIFYTNRYVRKCFILIIYTLQYCRLVDKPFHFSTESIYLFKSNVVLMIKKRVQF